MNARVPLTPPRDPRKVRRALRQLGREAPTCEAPPGAFVPVVEFAKCEGKKGCAEVCPFDVFEISRIHPEDYAELPWLAKLKSKVHGGIVAYTPRADACRACGLCVVACPEGAIRLAPRRGP